MIEKTNVASGIHLEDYDLHPSLAMGIRELNADASDLVPKIGNRKLWVINSTSKGGGVAEMLPCEVNLLNELGIPCQWIVATATRKEFFTFTKKLHNLIHGAGDILISKEEVQMYEEVNRENAGQMDELLQPGDIVVIHDPQPMAMACFIRTPGIKFVWRCHIGTNEHNARTRAAWNFLKAYTGPYSKAVFSASEYVPSYFAGKATVIAPAIDPLSKKNKELSISELTGILCNAHLLPEYHPVLNRNYVEPAKRLQPDGSFQSPLLPSDMGLLFKPTILQVSRWDKLKGFLPLMMGYAELRSKPKKYSRGNAQNERRIELSQLVLAGPDPGFVADDPEGDEVLRSLSNYYVHLSPEIREHISIIKLPMQSGTENNLMVNALQRAATIIVQNSLKEGFGLTITEAMWKAKPVIGTSAVGLRRQIQNEINGVIIVHPEDPEEVAEKLALILNDTERRKTWALNGQKKVVEEYLIFSSLRQWLQLFALL